jgi:hypothetical protein
MTTFRVHPVIGVARVGNSDDYIIAPETMAGRPPLDGTTPLTGGLPIRRGTEAEVIRSSDLRDASGALKRHAARFRVFSYSDSAPEAWPRGDGEEVRIGGTVDGKKVADIVWTVHVANKKTNWFVLAEDDNKPQGIASYDGKLPDIRNPSLTHAGAPQPPDKLRELASADRLRKLVIDPGPRVVSGASAAPVRFDAQTAARYFDVNSGAVVDIPNYPKSFPSSALGQLDCPAGPIDSLGEIQTDAAGRLLVLGGHGRAVAWKIDGKSPLDGDVNNDQWFDDTSDGPVSATIVFDDGTRATVHGAWVTTTDPSFAPQILNAVSMWDDVYDVWIRQLELDPDIFNKSTAAYNDTYKPTFDDQIAPIFKSASQQHWVANLSQAGISAHAAVFGQITSTADPQATPLANLSAVFRDPNQDQSSVTTLMPLHLGDAEEAMLSLRKTQHFFLRQWNKGLSHFRPGTGAKLGPGEFLDKATLVNCIGGRLSPGIDLTFVMREPALYDLPWQMAGGGPFRIRAKALAYDANLAGGEPFLGVGYVPRHDDQAGLEPGDLSKFMALPWHTDYNSCATHPPDPAVKGNRTVFWSWPAQRPVAVYDASQLGWGPHNLDDQAANVFRLGPQSWSVRGWGADAADAENWGRYQERRDMLYDWHRIGTVLQSPAIEPPIQHVHQYKNDPPGVTTVPDDWYLEVESQLRDSGQTPVVSFPNYATEIPTTLAPHPTPDGAGPTPDSQNPGAVRELFYQLLNVDEYPGAKRNARSYVDFWLKWAESYSLKPDVASYDRVYFEYSPQALEERMQLIYQELADDADATPLSPDDPGYEPPLFGTLPPMIERIKQFTPMNLLDGAWLRNIAKTGPTDEVRALLFSIWMDEFGDGEVSKNHCNIYLALCHSVGFYPPDLDSREFAFNTVFLDSAFSIPTFELAISQFTEDYYPEILGMTLQLEWEVLGLKPTRDLLMNLGLNPHFYVMHIGIDNAVNGHGRRALDAVLLYLQTIQETEGQAAVEQAWRRIWNGYVAFGQIGNLGADLENLIKHPPTLKCRMIDLIKSKAEFGSRNHQKHTLGETRINELFAVPDQFLELITSKLLKPGDWDNSQLNQYIQFEGGPMFRVFTDDEIDLLRKYTLSLSSPPTPATPKGLPPAAAMEAVIDQLKPRQVGTAGHTAHSLKDEAGVDHTVAWWFDQPPRAFMQALASPANGFISPGNPSESTFFTHWIASGGPMGSAFDAPAADSPGMTCRAVVELWITKGCPLPDQVIRMLRLTTASAKRIRHRTGRIFGMGSVH